MIQKLLQRLNRVKFKHASMLHVAIEEAMKRLSEIGQYGILASFGATAKYLNVTVLRRKPFVWAVFFGNIAIAFFAGNLAGEFVDAMTDHVDGLARFRDGIIMLTGYCAFPLLDIAESKLKVWAERFNPKS